MNKYSILSGRFFLAAIFLMSGLSKIGNFEGTSQYMVSMGMPLPNLFLIGAILLEVIGGISLILGYKIKWGATLLMIFLIPATLIFHNQLGDQMQMIMFMKNLSIFGGLLLVANWGAGDISLDNKLAQ